MECTYCEGQARWCENKEKYGVNYGKSYMCYLCECGAYVGCHNNTKKPLGTLANKQLQELRAKVHKKIDPYWQNGIISREDLYCKLSNYLKFTKYHTGLADIDTCLKILKIDMDELIN